MKKVPEHLKSKTPILAVILTLAVTAFSLSTYQAPSYAAPEAGQQGGGAAAAAAAQKPALPKKVTPPASKAAAEGPSGSKALEKVSDENVTYKDGTYEGSGTGYRGTTKVRVTIKDGKIAAIDVLSTGDDAPYFNRAKSLLEKIISDQTTNVDTVSGATYSSTGLIKAVRDALSKAVTKDKNKKSDKDKNKKPTQTKPGKSGKFPYPDGTYYGTAEGFVSNITVAVTIKNKTITKIKVVSQEEDEAYFNEAKAVVKRMVKAQSTKVDAVSGATYSSNGLINAVKQALKEAKKAAEEQAKPTDPTDPSDPTDPTKPTDSTDPTDPTKPTDASDPSDPSDKTDETDQTDPSEEASTYLDGTYSVTVPCYADEDEDFEDYDMSMDITIRGDKIVEITGVTGNGASSNNAYIKRAQKMIKNITAKGSADGVDTISGATCSCDSIINACRKAFAQAKR